MTGAGAPCTRAPGQFPIRHRLARSMARPCWREGRACARFRAGRIRQKACRQPGRHLGLAQFRHRRARPSFPAALRPARQTREGRGAEEAAGRGTVADWRPRGRCRTLWQRRSWSRTLGDRVSSLGCNKFRNRILAGSLLEKRESR